MHDIELTIQGGECRIRWVQDVAGHKVRTEGVFVEEELVAQLDEFRAQINAREIIDWAAVKSELPQDVAETTAQVKQLLSGFETSDNIQVFWCFGDIKV